MLFRDLDHGDLFKFGGRNFVSIDCTCEFASGLDGKWFAVEVGTGMITYIGPDNDVEPLVRKVMSRDKLDTAEGAG